VSAGEAWTTSSGPSFLCEASVISMGWTWGSAVDRVASAVSEKPDRSSLEVC
jgi:hypothetical protein